VSKRRRKDSNKPVAEKQLSIDLVSQDSAPSAELIVFATDLASAGEGATVAHGDSTSICADSIVAQADAIAAAAQIDAIATAQADATAAAAQIDAIATAQADAAAATSEPTASATATQADAAVAVALSTQPAKATPDISRLDYGRPKFWSGKALFHLFSPMITIFGGAIVGLFVIMIVCTAVIMVDPRFKCAGIYDATDRVMRAAAVVERNVVDFVFLYPIYLYAEHESNKGHFTPAFMAYETILHCDPDYTAGDILADQGNCYAMVGDNEKALASFSRAIQLYPKSARPHYNRGHLFQMQKNYPAALADYSDAIKAGSYRAYFRRLEVYKAVGMDELAKKDQERIDRYGYEDIPGSSPKLIDAHTISQHRSQTKDTHSKERL
jgi:tetratricopeptide (TPR) repeat protein